MADHGLAWWRTPPGVRRRFVDGRFGQIHVRMAGQAGGRVPVVCLHMSPSSSRSWERVLAVLGRDRLGLAPDTPGYGQSDPPDGPPSIADYAAAMGDMLDGLGLDRVDLVGFHTGSKIAVALARQQPARVRRLVLISAPCYTPEELAGQRAHFQLVEPVEDGSHLYRRWRPYRQFAGPGQTPELIEREFADSLLPGPHYEWGHGAAFAWQHADHLPLLRHPVLVLCPDDELRVQTMRAGPMLRNGSLQRLAGWGHGLLDVQAEPLARIITGFLDGPAQDLTEPPPAMAAPGRRPAAEDMAARPRRRFTQGRFGAVHLREAGAFTDRTPLVCLHPSPLSSVAFAALLPEMGRDRRALAMDSPGFGESEPPPEAPGIGDYADALIEQLEALSLEAGGGPVDLLGFHTGSLIASRIAEARPDLVRRLVMISAHVFTAEERGAYLALYGKRPLMEDGGHLVEMWLRARSIVEPTVPLELTMRNFAQTLRWAPVSWWGHNAAFRDDLAARLPNLRLPILVLNTQDDTSAATRRAAALLRNGRMLELEERTHGWIDRDPAGCARVLRGFLDG